jgi:hypothetical protein
MVAVTRRTLIFASIGTAALGGLGAGAALHLAGPAKGMVILNPEELDVIRALCEVWFPAGVFPIDGIQARVPEEVDTVLQDIMGDVQLAGFRYVLRTLQWGTMARWGRRFTQLDVEERSLVLHRWSDADVVPRRAAMDAVKAVLAIPYFRHPTIVDTIGWRTGCQGDAA